jgi:hypothetical protein
MCVVLTLANVGGFMHFWGLTIDTVSCTNLIISIGELMSSYHFFVSSLPHLITAPNTLLPIKGNYGFDK